MKTRYLTVFFSLMIVFSFLSVGGNSRKGCAAADNNDIYISVSGSSVSDTTTSKVDYPPVAPETITLEDGTGIISLGMSMDDVIKQFDEWNLNYTIHSIPDFSTDSDIFVHYGSFAYRFNADGILYQVDSDISSKGLTYGDSLDKMTELYGDDYEYNTLDLGDGDEIRYYSYNWPNGTRYVVEVCFEDSVGAVRDRWVCLQ